MYIYIYIYISSMKVNVELIVVVTLRKEIGGIGDERKDRDQLDHSSVRVS